MIVLLEYFVNKYALLQQLKLSLVTKLIGNIELQLFLL